MLESIKKFYRANNKLLLWLLISLVILVILDGVLTQYLVPNGKGDEGNPLIASLVGEPSFIILKVIGALVCAIILWDVHRRWAKAGMIATWIAVIVYTGIVAWNTSLVMLT